MKISGFPIQVLEDFNVVIRRGRCNRHCVNFLKKVSLKRKEQEETVYDAMGRVRKHDIDLDEAKFWSKRYLKRLQKQYMVTEKQFNIGTKPYKSLVQQTDENEQPLEDGDNINTFNVSMTNHRSLEIFQDDLYLKYRRFEELDKNLSKEELEKSIAKFKTLVSTDFKQTQR